MASAAVGEAISYPPPPGGKQTARQYTFSAGEEMRLEVRLDKTVIMTLIAGSAEVFGTDLSVGTQLPVTGLKLAVYTWYGATVVLDPGNNEFDEALESVYVSGETPMNTYLGVHDVLEQRRSLAKAEGGWGPVTILVGPQDVGKSSLCRLLLNYAVRMGHAPTAVDLDLGQGSLTVPGCIGATPVEVPVDIQEGLPADVPLVFFYGDTTPASNPTLYKLLVERLAGLLNKRASGDALVRAAGSIVNTMGWVEGVGYELLLHAVRTLKADVVLVMGQERLFNQLQVAFKASPEVTVVNMPRSGGVVTRDQTARRASRIAKLKEYFFGSDGRLTPHAVNVSFHSLAVYKVGPGPRAPTSALPIGASSSADPLRLIPVQSVSELANSILAVSYADTPAEILSSNVAGFLHVTKVDALQQMVTYLAPQTGPLPGRYLLLGSFKTFLE